MSNDYDLRDYDMQSKHLPDYLAQRVSGFAGLGTSHDAHSLLQKAKKQLVDRYGIGHIGDLLYLRKVADADIYDKSLITWAIEFGEAISQTTPENKYYRGALIKSYRKEWGEQASVDGLCHVLYGYAPETTRARAKEFGCDRGAYQKVRNYVAGALLVQYDQFQEELTYSWRVHQHEHL